MKCKKGVAEIQTVRTAGDSAFVREVQTITTFVDSGQNISGAFTISYGNSQTNVSVNCDATEAQMKSAIESLPEIGSVSVKREDSS